MSIEQEINRNRKSDWQIGFDLYVAGYADSHCANREQVIGWYDACAADTENRVSLQILDNSDSSIEDDYEWIRTGC
jgi:hypothetical protein